MPLVDWASAPPPWIGTGSRAGDARVLFTRTLRRRNFIGFPFWVSCSPEICAKIAVRAREFAHSIGLTRETVLADYSPEHINFFRERHWLPERPTAFPGKREYKRLYQGRDLAEHALAGEVEHWTHVRTRPGLPLSVDSPAASDSMKPDGLFAHAEPFGFLASNPSFAGTGLQVECGLHLPALTAARRMTQIQQALMAMGIEIQPLSLRLPGSADAGFFRAVSRGGMKIAEAELYRKFTGRIESVLQAEREATGRWEKREKTKVEDKVHRAFRLLQEARTLDYAEFLALSSFARLGVYLGHFPASLPERLEDLRVRMQPFHIGALQTEEPPLDADIFRAQVVRSALADLDSKT